jgi:hypothetical protein
MNYGITNNKHNLTIRQIIDGKFMFYTYFKTHKLQWIIKTHRGNKMYFAFSYFEYQEYFKTNIPYNILMSEIL